MSNQQTMDDMEEAEKVYLAGICGVESCDKAEDEREYLVPAIAQALGRVRAEEKERCAMSAKKVAQDHADFLFYEADHGGDATYLRARGDEAIHLRDAIASTLRTPQSGEVG